MYPVRNRLSWGCLLPALLLIVAHLAWGAYEFSEQEARAKCVGLWS